MARRKVPQNGQKKKGEEGRDVLVEVRHNRVKKGSTLVRQTKGKGSQPLPTTERKRRKKALENQKHPGEDNSSKTVVRGPEEASPGAGRGGGRVVSRQKKGQHEQGIGLLGKTNKKRKEKILKLGKEVPLQKKKSADARHYMKRKKKKTRASASLPRARGKRPK